MLFVGIASFLLLVIVVYLIAAPALRSDAVEEAGRSAGLLVRKEQLLFDIRELDLDLATGKMEEADHRRFRARALTAAATTLRELEELEEAVAREDVRAADDDPFEALISTRRQALEGDACPACAWPAEHDDAFCRHCGTALTTRAFR